MIYHLSETELNQIKSWSSVISDYYSETDATQLKSIIKKAIAEGSLNKNDIYALLEILPRIVPKSCEKSAKQEENETSDWQLYMDEQQAKYKRKMNEWYQSLSNWIFMTNAVCRRNLGSLKNPLAHTAVKKNCQKNKNDR